MTTDTNTTSALTGRKRWVALLFLALGVAMIILDATVVNVALPTIIEDLDLTTTDAEWVNAIYALLFASLLLLSGRLSDIFGRRLMFVSGVSLFAVASVLVASSGSSGQLIAARGLQGVAAAMILPASLSVLNAVYRGKDRAIAFAVWGATIGGMAALGPLVGGWLTTYATWHWAFLINVPIAIAVVIGVLLLVPETRDTVDKRGIDLPGALLGTLGLAALIFGLIEGQNYGWIKPKKQFSAAGFDWPLDNISAPGVALVLSAVLVASFVWVEARRKKAGKVVMVDLVLFRIRTFGMGNAVAAIVSLGEFGLLFILPLFLQSVIGYDALETGVILLALAAGSFLASGLGAGMAKRMGPVPVLRLGMALEVIGVLWIAVVLSTTVTGGDGAGLVRVRDGRRFRHRPTHRRDPLGGAGRGVRDGVGRAVDLAAGGCGHRDGAAGCGADHGVGHDHQRPDRAGGAGTRGTAGHRGGPAERGHGCRGPAATAERSGPLRGRVRGLRVGGQAGRVRRRLPHLAGAARGVLPAPQRGAHRGRGLRGVRRMSGLPC